jgi:hypothetical protein
MTVISGEIQTNILRHDRRRALPEDSIFAPLADAFANHVGRTPNTITPAQYATAVVAEAMKNNPKPWFWYGPTTWLVWRLETFWPKDAWVRCISPLVLVGWLIEIRTRCCGSGSTSTSWCPRALGNYACSEGDV